MRKVIISIRVVFIITVVLYFNNALAQNSPHRVNKTLTVRKCDDFEITGKGDQAPWQKTEWNFLTKLDGGAEKYESKFKILYSATGVYVLMTGKDDKITTEFNKDFENLYEADVFEVFFHTNPKSPLYLEYEVNQLNKELVLLIPNFKGKAFGWIPWHYEGDRQMRKMVNVVGGKMESGANITSWSAELFFPYKLFNPLQNVPPKSGTVWNANFYRLDYDNGKMIKWAWSPVKNSFHEFEKFAPIKFE